LHGVALRISLRSRSDATRRRVHERRCAELKQTTSRAEGGIPESWTALHEGIDHLPEHYREAVVLCYLEGLSIEEAALRLGCPSGTVLSRLARARERLRDRLVRKGLAPCVALLGTSSAPLPAAALPGPVLDAAVADALVFVGRRVTHAAVGFTP